MCNCSEEDIKKHVERARRYLSEYIKINTSDPACDCKEAVSFWMNIYKKEGIRYEIYTHESGKQSICGFIVENENNPSIVLLNHMDVVPANAENWDFSPFSGMDDDKYICGRGAIDMKGLAIIQLAAAIYAKSSDKVKKGNRNIVILSVPDEEVGGFKGAKFVVDEHLHRLNPEVVLDEGAFGIKEETGNSIYVSYSQRKSLWLRLHAYGKQGHGSQPSKDNANNILLKALEPFVKDAFYEAEDQEELMRSARISNMDEVSQTFFCNTVSITSICSRSAVNVIPGEAEAVLDCRLTPGTNVNEFIQKLHNMINDDRIQIEVIKRTDEVEKSTTSHKMLRVIEDVLKRYIGASRVIPIVSPVGTDSKFFRERGIQSYGFFPILLEKSELALMHGINEKISLENFGLGIKIMADVIIDYAEGEKNV